METFNIAVLMHSGKVVLLGGCVPADFQILVEAMHSSDKSLLWKNQIWLHKPQIAAFQMVACETKAE